MYQPGGCFVIFTRKAGGIPQINHATEEDYATAVESGQWTVTDWAYDPPRTETFDVDMIALCRIEAMVRPGVDRENGQPVGTWQGQS